MGGIDTQKANLKRCGDVMETLQFKQVAITCVNEMLFLQWPVN